MRHFAAGIADRGDRSWRQLVPQQQHGSRKAEKHVTWEKSCLCTMLSAPTNARWAGIPEDSMQCRRVAAARKSAVARPERL